eukprot:331407_1
MTTVTSFSPAGIKDSSIFLGHSDQKQFKSIYWTIYKSKNIPHSVIRQISEYATGSIEECDNPFCENDIATLNYANEASDMLVTLSPFGEIWEWNDEQVELMSYAASNCCWKFGYFMLEAYGDKQYYCEECVTKRELKLCEQFGGDNCCRILLVENDFVYKCGHKWGNICRSCNWNCSFCEREVCFKCTQDDPIYCCERCLAFVCGKGDCLPNKLKKICCNCA